MSTASANTPVDPELHWLHNVYQGDATRQLTVRAVVVGMLLGAVMCLSNLYTSLRTGWSFGVTITSGILAFGIFKALQSTGLVKTKFTMLENNAMQSVASAAGYMTGGGTVAAIPAVMMATESVMPAHVMFFWIMAIAMLGVFMAIPMKRQMIAREQLPFPSGIAAAETVRSLHAASEHGDGDGRTRLLLRSAGLAAAFTWLSKARAGWMPWNLPELIHLPGKMMGSALSKWSIVVDTSPLLVAAGMIMGWRSGWSVLLGGMINYFALAPYGVHIGAIAEVKYKAIVGWTVWFGSSMLLTSGLLAFAYSGKQVMRAFRDVGVAFTGGSAKADEDPLRDVEVPMKWFVWGMAIFGPLVTVLGMVFFGMTWWMGVLGIVLSFFIAVVAARATGETDTTPTGALGKITQLVFGAVAPGSVPINLMSANLSAGVALHASDLLTDLKSGYLLGAKPRQQFFGQFFGVIAGTLMVVPAFRLFVPDHTVLGTPAVPAPGAITWYSVARVLAGGLSNLPMSARWLILAGSIVGILLTLAERHIPGAKKWVPSPTGFGLAFTLQWSACLSMFTGALIARMLHRARGEKVEPSIVAVSSGVIAGESLCGTGVLALQVAGVLQR